MNPNGHKPTRIEKDAAARLVSQQRREAIEQEVAAARARVGQLVETIQALAVALDVKGREAGQAGLQIAVPPEMVMMICLAECFGDRTLVPRMQVAVLEYQREQYLEAHAQADAYLEEQGRQQRAAQLLQGVPTVERPSGLVVPGAE